MSELFVIRPGRLLQLGETLTVTVTVSGRLRLCRGLGGDFAEVAAASLSAGEPWQFMPVEPGMYLLEFTTVSGEVLRRPVAIVSAGWAVAQITVGSFTAEDFAATIHSAGLSADYYVNGNGGDFSWRDPRWRRYEREFGDAIYPHLMANNFGWLDPSLACADSNYDALSVSEIERRLRALQDWWVAQGYAPLAGLASYTPCNELVRALRSCGLRILHSVVPEQNWSDGDWAINHWGMPTCPFWVADDDFRKAGARAADGVLAITMNHYHVLLPHLTHWGDFVLSPSHFTRWIRAADSGEYSARFGEFLRETVSGWSSLSASPFFFVAGFEFGRTFGTADMTAYNQRGLEELIALSLTEKLAFATGPDVLAYYDRHCQRHPETVFRQRDHWFGVTVNGKPGAAGDSVVLERRGYKAVAREGELLPCFYYDYTVPWSFAARDVHAPRDFAPELFQQINVTVSGAELMVSASAPADRPVPVVVWDAAADGDVAPLVALPAPPVGEDGRRVAVLEIPADWSGTARVPLKLSPPPTVSRRAAPPWQLHTFGAGERRHTYLFLNAPLTAETPLTVTLSRRARVDSATGPLGELGPGPVALPFSLLRGWYRFWQCGVDDIVPESADAQRLASVSLTNDWPLTVGAHQERLNQLAAQRLADGQRVIYQVCCGANLPLGTRSRAAAWDAVTVPHPTISAREKGDGVIAFAPGQSFWYHPRGLSVLVEGLPDDAERQRQWKILLHSFDPQRLGARYRVVLNGKKAGEWPLPVSPDDAGAWFEIPVTVSDRDARGRIRIELSAEQKKLVRWWREGGFIAALHALWVIEEDVKGIV